MVTLLRALIYKAPFAWKQTAWPSAIHLLQILILGESGSTIPRLGRVPDTQASSTYPSMMPLHCLTSGVFLNVCLGNV